MDDLQKAILADEIDEISEQLNIIQDEFTQTDKQFIVKNVVRIEQYVNKLLENIKLSAANSAVRAQKCSERANEFAENATYILTFMSKNSTAQGLERDANVAAMASRNPALAKNSAIAAANAQIELTIAYIKFLHKRNWQSELKAIASQLMSHISFLVTTSRSEVSAASAASAIPSPGPFATPSTGAANTFQIGDNVDVLYKGKGTKWYSGKIVHQSGDGFYTIKYNDGDNEGDVKPENMRHNGWIDFKQGENVEVRYKKGTKWFSGTITSVNPTNTYDIHYTDGDNEQNVSPDYIRIVSGASASSATASSVKPAAGPSFGLDAPTADPAAGPVAGLVAASSVNPAAGPAAGLPSEGLLSLEELIPKIEKLPDSAVKRDLQQLIREENDTILVSKETVAVLEKLNSFGVNPYFIFQPLHGRMRITAKTGDRGLFYLQHPQEIAKLIYSLMDKAEIELVHYPRDLPAKDSAALSTLLADINSNFSILQSELDSLKPQFTKKVAAVFRPDAHTKKTTKQLITEEIKRLPRSEQHATRMAELDVLLKALNGAKKTYKDAQTRTNANSVDTRAADVKSFLKARQNDSNSTEMALYKNKAGSYDSGWDWLGRRRYHEKAGGTRKKRSKKTRRS